MTSPSGRRAAVIWLATAVAYLLYAVLAWLLGTWLVLHGSDLWLLRVGLWVLGLIAAGLVLWFLLESGSQQEAGSAGDTEDLDAILAAAEARLAEAGVARGHALRKLPLVLLVGPEGCTKTTVVVHSGLDPDLLGGEVFQNDQIRPTPAANIWYAHHAVLLEVGGRYAADAPDVSHLLHRIRPATLRAVLTRQPQAPRAVIVCFSCEEFLRPGSAQALEAAARELRALVLQSATGFGVQLPVYVLLTKADRVPYFGEFAHHLAQDECQQVLGTTLRWRPPTAAGAYAEQASRHLHAAFARLLGALAARRLELLARETDELRRAGTYEFPRELNKMVPGIVQFLVDLCRPSQLDVSPVLRGVYFTGVRAVVVSQGAPAQPPGARAAGRGGASRVLHPEAGAPSAPPSAPATRKIPEWLFLGSLFRDVILRDQVPESVAQAARNVSLLRRAALGAVTAMSIIAASCSTISYVRNRGAVAAAAALARAMPNERELPTEPTLRHMESVRTTLDRLSSWRRLGPYKGTGFYPELRRVYLERFNKLLLGPARDVIRNSLAGLPDVPNATTQYGQVLDLLHAYLMTTTDPDSMRAEFLVPELMKAWLDGRQVSSEADDLAHRQFTFYVTRLCRSFPCGSDANTQVVARTQSFLGQFAKPELRYQILKSKANAHTRSVRFGPSVAGVVVDEYEIPGAFTPQGWAYVQDALQQVDFTKDWALGSRQATLTDVPHLKFELRATYLSDYIRQWRGVLASASIVPFVSTGDAARKLASLGDNQSPLLQLLSFVSRNTNVDSQTVGAAFQPVHAIMPPEDTDHFVVESNQQYVEALSELGSVAQAASARPEAAEELAGQADAALRSARGTVSQLVANFNVDTAAGPATEWVRRLLEDPIDQVDRRFRSLPSTTMNKKGRDFCQGLGVLAKYPFTRYAGNEATLQEVTAVFHPNNGLVRQFYDENLQSLLIKQGTQYLPRPGASPAPTRAFVRFFNRLAAVSAALWPPDGTKPMFNYTIKLLPSGAITAAVFSMDGQPQRFTPTQTKTAPYQWVGDERARNAQISVEIRGQKTPIRSFNGQWALFKLLRSASSWRTVGSGSHLRWTAQVGGQPVALEGDLGAPAAALALLKGDEFDRLRCVSQVVR